jgi:hypothetical protein
MYFYVGLANLATPSRFGPQLHRNRFGERIRVSEKAAPDIL